jgi:hypothetical protein
VGIKKRRTEKRRGGLKCKVSDLLRNKKKKKCRIRREIEEEEENASERDMLKGNIDQRKPPMWKAAFH